MALPTPDQSLIKLARRFTGLREVRGAKHHPAIVWAHLLCGLDNASDEDAWCSSILNLWCFLAGYEHTKSARARSWLRIGVPIEIDDAREGCDIVILQRGDGPQPGADVITAPGHVGLYVKHTLTGVALFGGNQGDTAMVAAYPSERVIGVRRLRPLNEV